MKRKTMSSIYKHFESIHGLFAYLDKKSAKRPTGYLRSSCGTYDPEWYASDSYEEAKERCLKGDKNLAKMMRGSEKLDINIPCTGTRRKMVTGVVGFMPHVPNFLAGVPNSMIFVQEQKVAKKVIDVYYGCNTLADVSADEIAKVSARVLSCVMSLERKGYRVNLNAVNCAAKGSTKVGFSVKVKDAGQHIDVLKIAFPFLSAAWNRRFAFRFREVTAYWNGNMGGSVYGNELREFLDAQNVKYDVALSYYDAEKIKTVEELEKLFVNSASKLNK